MRIPLPMFTAPSYGDRTLNEVQRCVNLYPEKTPQGWKLISSPGLTLIAAVANNEPCRGAYYSSNGNLYSAHGDDLYLLSSSSATDVGDLSTSLGNVRFCDNGTYLLIVDGSNGYVLTIGSPGLTAIVDANFPNNPNWCAFKDGYFIVTEQGSDTFYLSALNDPTDWTPVTSAQAESAGDNIEAVVNSGNEILLLGVRTVEPWYNTGNADFPFERISGAIKKIGVHEPLSIAIDGETVYMVAVSDSVVPSVWAISTGQAQKVSPPYVDAALGNGVLRGFIYQHEGHTFYQINQALKSWVYDISTGAWHERESDVSSSYLYNRMVFAVNRGGSNSGTIACDIANGNFYFIASNSENGTAIRRRRAFGPIEAGARRMFHHRIIFVLEIDHDSSASYTLEASLDWTDDGGLTWSTARTLTKAITSGTTGQRVQLEALRLGSTRQRYYRITFTGPAARIVLQSAELEMDAGSN
jgi:hypothetical protein